MLLADSIESKKERVRREAREPIYWELTGKAINVKFHPVASPVTLPTRLALPNPSCGTASSDAAGPLDSANRG